MAKYAFAVRAQTAHIRLHDIHVLDWLLTIY